MTIGAETFPARLQYDLAPNSCALLETLMPYRGKLIHARWSGEACWSPLVATWLPGLLLPPENATSDPVPGQMLLFGGDLGEPELLIPYGPCRFASNAGPLAGNPVLVIEDRLARLVALGREILWRGAADLRIEHLAGRSCATDPRIPSKDCIVDQSLLPKNGEAEHADR
ncbi:MAG: DUF3830 family protein [Proteobacteria bacterium]|nr:DUF3830 family protein [Pseudomonadota bacterium]